MWFAFGIVGALDALCFASVWGTFLCGDATLLREVSIEDGPATSAAFRQVVASHDELNRQVWLFDVLVGVFHFHSALDCLDETVGVAGATGTLVSERASEVVAADVSQVKIGWHLVIRNVIRNFILVSEFLSPFSGNREFFGLFAEFLRARQRILLENLLFTTRFILDSIFRFKLVEYLRQSLVGNTTRVGFLFGIQLHIQFLFRKALSFIKSGMIRAQHAQIWPPMILVKVVRNFNNPFIARGCWLEAFVEITLLLFNARCSLLSGLVGLFGHNLPRLTLVNDFVILVLGKRFGLGLVIGSLG